MRATGARDHGTSMDDGPLPMRPQAVVAAYMLAALCLLIPLAVLGSTFALFGLLAVSRADDRG